MQLPRAGMGSVAAGAAPKPAAAGAPPTCAAAAPPAERAAAPPAAAKEPSPAAAAMAARFGGGGEKCTRCGKTVYAAERATAQGKVYHADCMRCVTCSVKLGGSYCADDVGGAPPTHPTRATPRPAG